MKKIIIICSVFFIVFIIYNITYKEEVIPVSLKEEVVFNIDEYNVFYLDLSEEDITTLNLKDIIFKDMDIISLNLYVNPIYKDKIGDIKYKYQDISLKRNIENMTNYYIDTIKNKGIIDDFSYLKVTGIKIIELEVYAKGRDIINLAYKYKNIKYKDYLNNNYNYIKF